MSASVVFMGSPAFAVPVLRALVDAGYQVPLVLSQPDRPAGRGGKVRQPEVKELALALGLETLQPETLKDPGAQARIAASAPDLIVVAAYGHILPRAVLAIPRCGPINVHASLLPRWRGASPIAAAILAGDAVTGVTIMEMAPKMDAGGIISQAELPVGAEDTTATLEPRLADLGARLLLETLPRRLVGEAVAVPQDESRVTYCGLVAKEDGHLKASMELTSAARAVRAYDPWPGAYVLYRGERLAVWRAHALAGGAGDAPVSPGTLRRVESGIAVAFAGGWLALDEVQRSGGKRVSAAQFLNGERGQLEAAVGLA